MPFTFLTAEWRKLIMAQYEVAPELLLPRLPPGLELDLFQGRCFVSLVGFLFDRVRILGVPVPLHTRFEEVNLRYYVRRKLRPGESPDPNGIASGYRRGVVFLSEIVPRWAVTTVARTLYGEAYSTAPMSHRWNKPQFANESLEVGYEWKHRGVWQRIEVRTEPRLRPMQAKSLQEFITEHYWGYTPRRAGGTTEYAVEHRRWDVYPVQAYRVAADFGSLYGQAFAELSNREPDNVLLAEGAPVKIRWAGRIT